jgi:hypothetical protein
VRISTVSAHKEGSILRVLIPCEYSINKIPSRPRSDATIEAEKIGFLLVRVFLERV